MILTIINGILGGVGLAIPGFGPKTFLALSAAIFISAFGAICYVKGQSGKEAALAEQRLEFAVAMQKEKEGHAEELRKARAAGDAEPALDSDRAKRVQQCQHSPTCRERKSGKK